MSTRWPSWSPAVSTSAWYAVSDASGSAPACVSSTPAGVCASWRDGAVTYSA
jgi:hypothetical protein